MTILKKTTLALLVSGACLSSLYASNSSNLEEYNRELQRYNALRDQIRQDEAYARMIASEEISPSSQNPSYTHPVYQNAHNLASLDQRPHPMTQPTFPSANPVAQPSLEEELQKALNSGDQERTNEILDLMSKHASALPSSIPTAHHPLYQESQESSLISSLPSLALLPQDSFQDYPHYAPDLSLPLPQNTKPTQARNLEAELNAALDQGNKELARLLTQKMASDHKTAVTHEVSIINLDQDESFEAQLERAMAQKDEQAIFRLLNDRDEAYAPKPSLVRDMALAFEAQGRGGNADQNQFMRGYQFDHGGRFVTGDQRDPSRNNNTKK